MNFPHTNLMAQQRRIWLSSFELATDSSSSSAFKRMTE
jgi:hypothetical protein